MAEQLQTKSNKGGCGSIIVGIVVFIAIVVTIGLFTETAEDINKSKSADTYEGSVLQSRKLIEQKRDSLDNITFSKTKAGYIQKRHPEWSKEDCKLLAKGKIWIGMHIDMVKYLRGQPNSANPSNYGDGVKWQWCWSSYSPSCFYDDDNDGKIDSYN